MLFRTTNEIPFTVNVLRFSQTKRQQIKSAWLDTTKVKLVNMVLKFGSINLSSYPHQNSQTNFFSGKYYLTVPPE